MSELLKDRISSNISEEELFYKIADKGIDAVFHVIEKRSFLNTIKKLMLSQKLRLTNRNQSIKKWCEKKFGSEMGISNFSGNVKNPFRVRYINFERGNKSLSNTMIVIENSVELNNLCKERKKRYGTYVKVVFAGLFQPTRAIKPLTMKVLKTFLSKYNIWDMDLAVDILSKDKSSDKRKFKNAVKGISSDDSKIYTQYSTTYANSCVGKVEKVLIYDKYIKESIYHKQRLCKALKNWKRIELRVRFRKRFSKITGDEILRYKDMLDDIARNYSDFVLFGVYEKTLNAQIAYLKDGRRKIKSEVKFKEWIA